MPKASGNFKGCLEWIESAYERARLVCSYADSKSFSTPDSVPRSAPAARGSVAGRLSDPALLAPHGGGVLDVEPPIHSLSWQTSPARDGSAGNHRISDRPGGAAGRRAGAVSG